MTKHSIPNPDDQWVFAQNTTGMADKKKLVLEKGLPRNEGKKVPDLTPSHHNICIE